MALIPCSQCGHMISDKAYNCPKCGKSINASTQPTTSGNNSDNKGYKTAILVTIIVILAIALIVVLVIAFNKNKHDDKDYHKSDKFNPVEEVVVEEPVTLYDDYQEEDNSISLYELKSFIREYNDELPEYIDEGMDLETVYLDGDYVVYSYSLDEDIYDIDYFRTNRSDVKRSLKNELFNNTEEDVKIFIKACKDNNKGIAYRFVGLFSGDACTIYISPNEL